MKVWHTTSDIRAAVNHVLDLPGTSRYAIVAFIGRQPLRLLSDPKGLQVYCWPLAGGTHPEGIDALIIAGAKVFFVQHLHAKV